MFQRSQRPTYLVACVALAVSLTASIVWAVRLSSDADEDRPAPPPVPVPPDSRPDALVRYVDRLVVEGPYGDRGLTVFTLSTRAPEIDVQYLTLDEGISSGQIVIEEVKGGSVPMLQVRNLSDRWAFLMAGEIVTGGKQNRTVQSDTLLPPHGAAWTRLPVCCVEQHRWGAEGKFDTAKSAAPNAMRSGLNQGYDQGEVWRESARAQESAGVRSATGDVTVVYRDAKTARAVDEATDRLIRCIPRREYVGLVVARGGEIVSADLFANGALYSKLYEKVIRSHVVEMLGKTPAGAAMSADARAFLSRVRGTQSSRRPAPGGTGQTVTVSGNGIGGEWLEVEGCCVHAGLFPQVVRPVPIPVPRRMED